MKLLAILSGIISLLLILIGSLFKIMHWPFGSTTLIVGYFLLAIVFLPSLARYIYLKSQ